MMGKSHINYMTICQERKQMSNSANVTLNAKKLARHVCWQHGCNVWFVLICSKKWQVHKPGQHCYYEWLSWLLQRCARHEGSTHLSTAPGSVNTRGCWRNNAKWIADTNMGWGATILGGSIFTSFRTTEKASSASRSISKEVSRSISDLH